MVEIVPTTGCGALRFGESYDAVISMFGIPKTIETHEKRGYINLFYENLQIALTNGALFTEKRPNSEFRVITIMCSDPNAILFGRKVIGLSLHRFLRWISKKGLRFERESEMTFVAGRSALHVKDLGLTVDFCEDRLRRVIVETPFSNLFG